MKKLLKFNRDSARKHNLNGPVIHDLFTVLSNIGDMHHDKQKIKLDINEYGKIFKSKNGKEITWLNNFDRKKYLEYLKIFL